MDTVAARQNTIDSQVRPWGGLNDLANHALQDIPREVFVPKAYQNLAFADIEIPLTDKAKMFSPKLEGRLLSTLNIQQHETALEIGTGSGYLTAVLAKLGQSVVSVEIDANLSAQAAEKLQSLGIKNVRLEVGDATSGWTSNDFFDVVVIGSAVPKITTHYLHWLSVGGRLFVVEGSGAVMSAKCITRINQHQWQTQSLFETHLDTMQGLETPVGFTF